MRSEVHVCDATAPLLQRVVEGLLIQGEDRIIYTLNEVQVATCRATL